jgi:hypothetical protein
MSTEPQLLGLSPGGIPEPDTLHPPFNLKFPAFSGHGHYFGITIYDEPQMVTAYLAVVRL